MRPHTHTSIMAPQRRLSKLANHLAPVPTYLKSINHIARGTENVPRLVAFYKEVLGFEDTPGPKGAMWLTNGDMMVHVVNLSNLEKMNQKDGEPEPSHWQKTQAAEKEAEIGKLLGEDKPRKFLSGIGQHLAFQTDDVNGLIDKLKAQNVRHYVIEHKKNAESKASGGNAIGKQMVELGLERQVFFYDPDGNGIEVANYGDEVPKRPSTMSK